MKKAFQIWCNDLRVSKGFDDPALDKLPEHDRMALIFVSLLSFFMEREDLLEDTEIRPPDRWSSDNRAMCDLIHRGDVKPED